MEQFIVSIENIQMIQQEGKHWDGWMWGYSYQNISIRDSKNIWSQFLSQCVWLYVDMSSTVSPWYHISISGVWLWVVMWGTSQLCWGIPGSQEDPLQRLLLLSRTYSRHHIELPCYGHHVPTWILTLWFLLRCRRMFSYWFLWTLCLLELTHYSLHLKEYSW